MAGHQSSAGFLTEAGYQDGNSEPKSGKCLPYPPSFIGSPLYRAVLLGDKHLLQKLLSNHHVSAGGRCGRNILCIAVKDSREDLVDVLLNHGASPVVADFQGRTPLHYAAYKGLDGCLKLLLQSCESRDIEVSSVLLQHDHQSVTPLHLAAILPSSKCLQVMLKYLQQGAVDPQDHNKRTPLHWAAMYGSASAIALLARHGANSLTPDSGGCTPLHWAVRPARASHHMHVVGARAVHINNGISNSHAFDNLSLVGGGFDAGRGNGEKSSSRAASPLTVQVASANTDIHSLRHSNSTSKTGDVEGYECVAQLECVTKLLHTSPPDLVNWQDYTGATALHVAAWRRCTGAAKLLLSRVPPAACDSRDNTYRTPLHFAAISGSLQIMRLLVRHGARLDATDERGATPLHYAAVHRHVDCVRLGSVVVPFTTSVGALQPLGPSWLAMLSQQPGVRDSQTPSSVVEWAAEAQADDSIAIMVQHGAQLVAVNKDGGEWCPGLHVAAARGHVSTVALLLKLFRQPNSCDDAGTTPLMAAAYSGSEDGHISCVKFLLRHDASLQQRDAQGRVALHYAAQAGRLYMAQRLVSAGTDPNTADAAGAPALHAAAAHGHVGVLAMLLENRADPDARDYQGNCALHCAAVSGQEAAVAVLLEAGAHTSFLRCGGSGSFETPLDCAVSGGHSGVVEALRQHGAFTADEVRTAAAVVIQRYFRHHLHRRRHHSQLSEGARAAAVVTAVVAAHPQAAVTPRVMPVSVRGLDVPLTRSRDVVQPTSRLSLIRDTPVTTALVRAARQHSSCRELKLPPVEDLNLADCDTPTQQRPRPASVPANPAQAAMLNRPTDAVRPPATIAAGIVLHGKGNFFKIDNAASPEDNVLFRKREVSNSRERINLGSIEKSISNDSSSTKHTSPGIDFVEPAVPGTTFAGYRNQRNDGSSSSSSSSGNCVDGPVTKTDVMNTSTLRLSLVDHVQRQRHDSSVGGAGHTGPTAMEASSQRVAARRQKIEDFKKKKKTLQVREVPRASIGRNFSYNLQPARPAAPSSTTSNKATANHWRS